MEGEGPPLLVSAFFVESFSVDYVNPWYQRFLNELGRGRTMIRYDPRGVGLSQRDVEDLSVWALVKDLEAVADAAELAEFCLLTAAAGTTRAIAYAAAHGDQLSGLVLLDGFARSRDVFSKDALKSLAEFARTNWHVAAQAMTARIASPEGEEAWVEMYRRSVTGDHVARLLLSNLELDVSHLLSRIKVPTLIGHDVNQNVVRFALGQQLAAAIPGATFVSLQSDDPNDYMMMAVPPIESFLRKHSGEPLPTHSPTAMTFRTVFFTDLVGHTEMMSRLGDERGREVLREHEAITRDVLKQHNGAEIKTLGDGFMASFGSVTKAVECAIAPPAGVL